MLNLNGFQTLLTAAESYFYFGYSLIPLLGDCDPTRPKVAARAWSAYQSRLASLDEIKSWFSPEGGAAGLGIVTGRISHLAVLDFDSPDLLADFRRRCPDLLETRTVQSAGRGLPHLYFHVPSHLRLASQKRQGVDLLSDGRYVVAPPTSINGSAYLITRGGMPRTLTENDLRRINAFMSDQKNTPHSNGAPLSPISSAASPLSMQWRGAGDKDIALSSANVIQRGIGAGNALPPLSTHWRGAGGEDASHPILYSDVHTPPTAPSPLQGALLPLPEGLSSGKKITRANLYGLYAYWRTRFARNEALFRTALYARDHGWDQTQTRHALVTLHISQSGGTVKETQASRQREAYATIRSVFSRPARKPTPSPVHQKAVAETKAIPNSVREALMQSKQTHVIRTLEGLFLAEFHAGKGFTADQAIAALKGIVGRDSVYNALNAKAPNGKPFFPQRVPSALPDASNEAATSKSPLKTKKCFFVTEKKSGIKKRGIKARRFKMPRIADLCRLLGVQTSGSDPLTHDDLRSAHGTRMALHRELIKRRPAEYSRRWLANRLGVSRRTLDTYNRLIPIHTRAVYQEITLSWANLDSHLTDEVLDGAHIETLMGKKYPALHAIAKHLLAKGMYIRLKHRSGSLYWYGSDEPPPNILQTTRQIELSDKELTNHATKSTTERDYTNRPYPGRENPENNSSVEAHGCAPSPQPSQTRGKKHENKSTVGTQRAASATLTNREKCANKSPSPTAQQETLAQTLYTRVEGLSLKNARKLATTYSEQHIHAALDRLQHRTNLDNPCGFFVSVLRSSARMEAI